MVPWQDAGKRPQTACWRARLRNAFAHSHAITEPRPQGSGGPVAFSASPSEIAGGAAAPRISAAEAEFGSGLRNWRDRFVRDQPGRDAAGVHPFFVLSR